MTATRKVRTKDNTRLDEWVAYAKKAFADRGMPDPTPAKAFDAYEVGESPETWADYVKNS